MQSILSLACHVSYFRKEQKEVLSLFVNAYMYSRSNPKSTAGRGELNRCKTSVEITFWTWKRRLVLKYDALVVALTIIFPSLITVDLTKDRLLQVLEKVEQNLLNLAVI